MVLFCIMTGTAEQFQSGEGGADVECRQKSLRLKYIPFEQWRSQS